MITNEKCHPPTATAKPNIVHIFIFCSLEERLKCKLLPNLNQSVLEIIIFNVSK